MSVSSEKLRILTDAASRMVHIDPSVLERIESLEITWIEDRAGDVIVPNVRIQFHPPKPKLTGGGCIG